MPHFPGLQKIPIRPFLSFRRFFFTHLRVLYCLLDCQYLFPSKKYHIPAFYSLHNNPFLIKSLSKDFVPFIFTDTANRSLLAVCALSYTYCANGQLHNKISPPSFLTCNTSDLRHRLPLPAFLFLPIVSNNSPSYTECRKNLSFPTPHD